MATAATVGGIVVVAATAAEVQGVDGRIGGCNSKPKKAMPFVVLQAMDFIKLVKHGDEEVDDDRNNGILMLLLSHKHINTNTSTEKFASEAVYLGVCATIEKGMMPVAA